MKAIKLNGYVVEPIQKSKPSHLIEEKRSRMQKRNKRIKSGWRKAA